MSSPVSQISKPNISNTGYGLCVPDFQTKRLQYQLRTLCSRFPNQTTRPVEGYVNSISKRLKSSVKLMSKNSIYRYLLDLSYTRPGGRLTEALPTPLLTTRVRRIRRMTRSTAYTLQNQLYTCISRITSVYSCSLYCSLLTV
jgi:hypothetical protein